MSIPHFFIDQPIEAQVGKSLEFVLPKFVSDHLHTLRVRAGEQIVLVDFEGHGWHLTLNSPVDKKDQLLCAEVIGELSSKRKTDLTLIQGISATDRMDQTVRQVTELAVAKIIPLQSERSTVRLDKNSKEKKLERWKRVARGAAEQSGQLHEPTIHMPISLDQVLASLSDYDLVLLFWEELGGCSISEAFDSYRSRFNNENLSKAAPQKVAIFVGPEGGFSKSEAELVLASGAHAVSIGETILRTETAAVVASALTLYQLGGLGAGNAGNNDGQI